MSALMFAAFVMVLGCAGNALAQAVEPPKDVKPPMVGGFKAISVKDKQVVDATSFAVKTIAKNEEMDLTLDSILDSYVQVGQIFNFKLSFKVNYADGGEVYPLCVNAVVSRNMKKQYKLVNWDSNSCDEDSDGK